MNRLARTTAIVVLLPTLLGASRLLGTTYNRFYNITSTGVSYGGTVDTPNNNGDKSQSFLCKVNCTKVLCSMCHASSADRSKETYTQDAHDKTYYPKFVVPATAGYKVAWGSYGGSIVLKNGQYVYVLQDGRVNMTAPTGTLPVKDRLDVPFARRMLSAPVIGP